MFEVYNLIENRESGKRGAKGDSSVLTSVEVKLRGIYGKGKGHYDSCCSFYGK